MSLKLLYPSHISPELPKPETINAGDPASYAWLHASFDWGPGRKQKTLLEPHSIRGQSRLAIDNQNDKKNENSNNDTHSKHIVVVILP